MVGIPRLSPQMGADGGRWWSSQSLGLSYFKADVFGKPDKSDKRNLGNTISQPRGTPSPGLSDEALVWHGPPTFGAPEPSRALDRR